MVTGPDVVLEGDGGEGVDGGGDSTEGPGEDARHHETADSSCLQNQIHHWCIQETSATIGSHGSCVMTNKASKPV